MNGRMDLVVTNSNFSTTLADVPISHPSPFSNQTITPAMTNPGYFAQYREKVKQRKCLTWTIAVEAKFFPLVLETFGTIGQSFHCLINQMTRMLFQNSLYTDAENEKFLMSRMVELWRCRISAVFQRVTATRVLLKGCRVLQAKSQLSPPIKLT